MHSHGRIGAGVGVNLVPWPPVQHSPYAYPAQAAAYAGRRRRRRRRSGRAMAGAYPVWQVEGGPQLYTERDPGFAGADARTRAMVGAAARRRQKSQIYGKILPDCGGFLDCQPCERPQYDKCGFPVGRPPGRRPVPGRPGGGGNGRIPGGGGNGRIPGGGGGVTLCPDGRLPDANGRCPHSVPMPTPTPTPTPYPGGGGVPDVWQQPWATPQPQPAPVPQYPIGVFQSAAALGCPAGFVPDGAGGCTPVVG